MSSAPLPLHPWLTAQSRMMLTGRGLWIYFFVVKHFISSCRLFGRHTLPACKLSEYRVPSLKRRRLHSLHGSPLVILLVSRAWVQSECSFICAEWSGNSRGTSQHDCFLTDLLQQCMWCWTSLTLVGEGNWSSLNCKRVVKMEMLPGRRFLCGEAHCLPSCLE